MRYRRADVKGGTYFFTINLAQRHLRLLLDHVDILRTAVKTVKQRHPFHIDAFVVLPDHLHAIWTLPPDDADFATRWMLIKSGFSVSLQPHHLPTFLQQCFNILRCKRQQFIDSAVRPGGEFFQGIG